MTGSSTVPILTPVSRTKFTCSMRALFVVQVVSQAYVSTWHVAPWFLEGAAPVSVSVLQVTLLYLCVLALLNWACVIWFSSEYTSSAGSRDVTAWGFLAGVTSRADAFFLPVGGEEDGGERGLVTWRRCERCDVDVPPRAVHCRFCRTCVLRRDHHCHLVGCCIGHRNQRFFVVLAAQSAVLSCVGGYLSLSFLYHLHHLHHPQHLSLWVYFLPVTLWKWLWGGVSSLQAILTFHSYMLCLFGPISSHYFVTQMCLIGSGRTKREVQRRMKVVVTSSVCTNLRLVFGPCWYLSLLLPLPHLLFPQQHQGLSYHHVKMLPD
ncbi:putative palmitoyltransferase ZDHHC24 [Babylonia areolata]|uniref:putative palmitoyltransferase ZDHHC24 n=1 Tax=Babylonia areolata TaxID=304850 RepID=UPI003FD0D6A9